MIQQASPLCREFIIKRHYTLRLERPRTEWLSNVSDGDSLALDGNGARKTAAATPKSAR